MLFVCATLPSMVMAWCKRNKGCERGAHTFRCASVQRRILSFRRWITKMFGRILCFGRVTVDSSSCGKELSASDEIPSGPTSSNLPTKGQGAKSSFALFTLNSKRGRGTQTPDPMIKIYRALLLITLLHPWKNPRSHILHPFIHP